MGVQDVENFFCAKLAENYKRCVDEAFFFHFFSFLFGI